MLKIGEFSRLSQVTIKTLHHYDELGLLKPAQIDPITNYRFYTVEQLPRIHRIVALKEMGLSLEQIGILLEKELPTEEMRGMLRMQQAQIQQQVNEAQRQLAMVEFRLRMIEAESNFPELDVVMKRLVPMRYLSLFVPTHPSIEHGMKHMMRTATALNNAIAQGVIQHTGLTLDIFHGDELLPFHSPDISPTQHEIRLSVTEAQKDVTVEEIGHLVVREEPAKEHAATLMIANTEIGEGFEKWVLLHRWTIAQGYKPHPILLQVAHRGPLHTFNIKEWILEAQIPVEVDG
ncbi:MAG: helix-turn-helix domain-containing protein [Anaerolineales bacterium]|nr:helix-turn-helix domain-containing protein [Anaerolineales bacterium]